MTWTTPMLCALFLGLVGAPRDLPMMDEDLSVVAAGTAVELRDSIGLSTHLVIDPDDVGDPARDGFLDLRSPQGMAIVGAARVEGPAPDEVLRRQGGVHGRCHPVGLQKTFSISFGASSSGSRLAPRSLCAWVKTRTAHSTFQKCGRWCALHRTSSRDLSMLTQQAT